MSNTIDPSPIYIRRNSSNLPVFGEENGSVWHGVKERPKRTVAAAIVKLSKLIFLHEDGHNLPVLKRNQYIVGNFKTCSMYSL